MDKIISGALSIFVEFTIWLDRLFRRNALGPIPIDYFYNILKSTRIGGLKRTFNYFRQAYYRKLRSKTTIEDNLVFLDCFWGRSIGCHPYAIYKEIVKDKTHNWKFIWVKNKDVQAPKDI